jgi:Na+-transporting NADH:ubiquinone oxidoreductase subunit NqrF
MQNSNYEIMVTKEALSTGYWSINEQYFKEWEKYSVVESKSKIILMTSQTKIKAETYINYLNGAYELPEEMKKRMRKIWR